MGSFPLEFQNYLKAEDYSAEDTPWAWLRIFVCAHHPIHQPLIPIREIADKIISLFESTLPGYCANALFQFWTVVIRGDRCLLTTRNQPFLISIPGGFTNGLWKYRMACKDYEVYVDSHVEESGLGVVGRVFRHRSVETTPKVKYYTIQEYPLRDVAQSCGIKELTAVPMFEPSGLRCVGVLEIVLHSNNDYIFTDPLNDICEMLREVGLAAPIIHNNHYERHKDEMSPVLEEIKKTLEESCKSCEVCLCQAWAPCTSCNYLYGDVVMGLLFQEDNTLYKIDELSSASNFVHLRKGQGIAGRTFSSGMPSLCMDTTKLNLTNYPLAHFARIRQLNGCFAICFQSNHTENNVFVLEFFFKYSGDPYPLLYKILEVMKKHLLSFKVASGQELGEKLPIIVFDSEMNERPDFIQVPEKRELVQHPIMDAMTTGRNNAGEDPNGILNSNSKRTRTTETVGKQCRKSGIPITLEDIQQQFGKKLQDAAVSLGVRRSTFKRACREHEIPYWHLGKRNNGYHAASNASNEDIPQDQVLPPSLNFPCQPPATTGTSEMQNYIPLESTNTIDIKVMYEDKSAIRFQLSLPFGIAGLKQQVIKRLNGIDFENYSLQYKDEENDWISIRCDEDLHYYLSSSTSSTKTLVTIYLKPFKLFV